MYATKWFDAISLRGKSYAVRFQQDWHQGAKQFRWEARTGPSEVIASGIVKGPTGAWTAREVIEDALREALGMKTLAERLVALTPGGSEFHDDPDRCLDWLEKRRWEVVDQVLRRKALEDRVQELMALLKRRASECAAMPEDEFQQGYGEALGTVTDWLRHKVLEEAQDG